MLHVVHFQMEESKDHILFLLLCYYQTGSLLSKWDRSIVMFLLFAMEQVSNLASITRSTINKKWWLFVNFFIVAVVVKLKHTQKAFRNIYVINNCCWAFFHVLFVRCCSISMDIFQFKVRKMVKIIMKRIASYHARGMMMTANQHRSTEVKRKGLNQKMKKWRSQNKKKK